LRSGSLRALQVTRLDGPDAVQVSDIPVPTLTGDDQVLVRVHAAGVTFPDVLLSRGEYQVKPDLPFVLGSEFAGEVVEAGAGSRFARGDRVVGVKPFGAFAEVVVGPGASTLALPDAVSYVDGAGMPMNLLTADFALRARAQLRAGETVLVHGAAGGLGYAAVQLAASMGAHVVAVTSSPAKADVARLAGAHEVVAVEGFLDSVRELTAGRGVDVVVDPVGGDRFTDSLRALGRYGRLLVLGFAGGEIPTVRVNRLLLNNISVVGVGWGAATQGYDAMVTDQWEHLLPMVSAGRLNPHVDRTVPLERAAEAVSLLADRTVLGKVVLVVRDGVVQDAP
jgi:NADPH2:quinone reductase